MDVINAAHSFDFKGLNGSQRSRFVVRGGCGNIGQHACNYYWTDSEFFFHSFLHSNLQLYESASLNFLNSLVESRKDLLK